MTSCDRRVASDPGRRRLMAQGLGAGMALGLRGLPVLALTGGALAGAPALSQTTTATAQPDSTVSDGMAQEFLAGAVPVQSGLVLDLPALGDNPAAVPVKVMVTEELTDELWCEELIVLAELNPMPLACRLRFSAATGTAEAAVRLRLIETMHVRALARLSDGRVLEARQSVTVAAGGCGM